MSSIGEKVAALRSDRGWTLKHLSQISGVSVSHISAIENDTRPNPSIHQILKIAHAFGVPLAHFDDSNSGPSSESTTEENSESTDGVPPLAFKFLSLYDAETQHFIVSEKSKPYVALAMKLAQQDREADASSLLQLIAQFMRDRQSPYNPL